MPYVRGTESRIGIGEGEEGGGRGSAMGDADVEVDREGALMASHVSQGYGRR